jgi:response regulator NasT
MQAVRKKAQSAARDETAREPDASARILLADDDRLILAVLGEGLRKHGYEVRTAANGEEALRLCETDPPDLALLDMRMPGLDGIETARALRSRTRVPYLFLSAYSDSEVVKRAAEEGALGYLVKPLDVSQVIPPIEAALACATEIADLRQSESHLSQALAANRDTATAVGLIMERQRLGRQEAFEALRRHARSRQRKLEDVAFEILQAAEALALPDKLIAQTRKPRS